MERINKTTAVCANCDYYFNGECIIASKCDGIPIKVKNIYQMRESDEAKLALAKDYIAKALKLIEEIER